MTDADTSPMPSNRRWHAAVRVTTFLFDHLGPLVILFCASLALATWYGGQQLVWGDDATHPMSLDEISTYFHVSNAGLGAPDTRKLPFVLPIGAILMAWKALGIPYDLTVLQPLVVVALLAIGGWSSYFMVRTLLPSAGKVGALIGALVYVFNPYSMTTVWSAMSYLSFHYCFLPLALTSWMLVLTRRVSIWFVPPVAALWALTLTPAYIATPVAVTDALLFGGVTLFAAVTARGLRDALSAVGRAAFLYGTWLALNLFWIVPFVSFASAETTRGLSAGDPRQLFALNSAPFLGAIRLAGYWGVNDNFAGSPYFPWSRYFADVGVRAAFALPLIALVGIVAVLRSRSLLADDEGGTRVHPGRGQRGYLAFFAVLLLSAVTLMTGVHDPLGGAKEWAFGTLGLDGPFRSVYQRFGVYAALAYAPLVAVGTFALQKAIRARAGQAAAFVSAGIVAVLVTVLPALPLWTGGAFDRSGIIPSRRITIPNDYRKLAPILDEPPGDFNVLVLPYGGSNAVSVFQWENGDRGYFGVDPISLLVKRPALTGEATAPYLQPLVRNIVAGGTRALPSLRLLNARFIVLHLDANMRYLKNRSGWIGLDVKGIANRLELLPDVHLVYASEKLRAYSWVGWRPSRFFAVQAAAVAAPTKGRSAFSPRVVRRPIPYHVDDMGRFTVKASEVRPGELLVMNQAFDQSWRAGAARSIRIEPGVTAFNVRGADDVDVRLPIEQRFELLLLIVPAGLLACGASLAWAVRGSRSRSSNA